MFTNTIAMLCCFVPGSMLRDWHRPLFLVVTWFTLQVVYQRWVVGPAVFQVQFLDPPTLFWIRAVALGVLAAIILCDDLLDLLGIRQV